MSTATCIYCGFKAKTLYTRENHNVEVTRNWSQFGQACLDVKNCNMIQRF